MGDVFREVDFLRTPETIHLFLIHIPDCGVLDGEQNKPVLVHTEF